MMRHNDIYANAKQKSLFSIILCYIVIGFLFAIYTPRWQAPDEPAHYNYIRQLADGNLPIIEVGDYNQSYISEIVRMRFPPEYSIDRLEYEDWQPPLYYLLQVPVFLLSDGSLFALRLMSMLFGIAIIILAYLIVQQVFPDSNWIALTTAVFVAFLPQHIFLLATVNNDTLAGIMIAMILWLLFQYIDLNIDQIKQSRLAFFLGISLGMGFLTKGTVYPLALVVGAVLLTKFWADRGLFIRESLKVFTPAIILGSCWWGRNVIIYGGVDILGKLTHDTIVIGQPLTSEWVVELGKGEVLKHFFQTTFQSFWGQFGWMAVPMPLWTYKFFLLFSVMAALGLLLGLISVQPLNKLPNRLHIFPLILTTILTFTLYIGYNFTFVQHQGRYLFPALIPIGLSISLGLGMWFQPLISSWSSVRYILPVGLAIILIIIDLFALFHLIVPLLA